MSFPGQTAAIISPHDVIGPWKPTNHWRAAPLTSFSSAAVFRTSEPKSPTSCETDRARRSAHPGRSRRRCWSHQTGTAERSWLTRCCRKTGRNSWCKRWRWSRLWKKETKRDGAWLLLTGRCIFLTFELNQSYLNKQELFSLKVSNLYCRVAHFFKEVQITDVFNWFKLNWF